MAAEHQKYAQLCGLLREAGILSSVSSLLAWDQETYMPGGGGGHRAEQMAMLATLTHQRRTDSRLGDLLQECEGIAELVADAESPAARNLREIRRDFDRATKLPGDLVAELARAGSQCQQAWKEARQNNDFKGFVPHLDRMMRLTRRKAECYGAPAGGELYDALLDEYEPGATAKEIEAVFTPLRKDLAALIAGVARGGKAVNTKPLFTKIDPAAQHALGLFVLGAIGFDLNCGRLDTTAHPFCQEIGPGDTRLTTRYVGEKFTNALFGTLHEAGHGMYEQNLPKAGQVGQPLGESISLGIHESQSRMWENFVGRSRHFWAWLLPKARKHVGAALSKYKPDQLFAAVNTASPSLIRVDADETTYNMHVMIRFELERGLISGSLPVKDISGEWNSRYKSYLGIKVPDDKRGCLQDVHWSAGLIGYFPTYTLGNLYAAQFWEKINSDIKDLPKQIGKGQFGGLKAWLVKNIHSHGRRYRAGELCERVTGKPLTAAPLLRHLTRKAEAVYGISTSG